MEMIVIAAWKVSSNEDDEDEPRDIDIVDERVDCAAARHCILSFIFISHFVGALVCSAQCCSSLVF